MTGADARPAWLVLDAARSHRFTGEVVFRTDPVVRVSFDRGEIYVAERTSDPSLAHRLVDAGVLTADQVERGSVRVGGVRHLGRLFDRVPGLDPHVLLAAVDLLTEECISWLASRPVTEVAWVPYRRHPSGVFQWRRYDDRSVVELTDPMLSPLAALRRGSSGGPDDISIDRPSARVDATADTDTGDVLIEWEEPTWLDRAAVGDRPTEPREDVEVGQDEAVDHDPDPFEEWSAGAVATAPRVGEPLSSRRRPVDHDPIDRFELVWPSGEVDDQLGSIDEPPVVVEPNVPVGSTGGSRFGDTDNQVRPSTTIRRASPSGVPSAVAAGESPDDIDVSDVSDVSDFGGPGDVGIDAHPSTRRRMLPRRR